MRTQFDLWMKDGWKELFGDEPDEKQLDQFYRYYELYFRRSPLEELTDARLQRVRYLLASSSLSVQQAAAASGFRSICHFNRFFRLRCGCTPTEFREAAFGRTEAPKPVDISAAP